MTDKIDFSVSKEDKREVYEAFKKWKERKCSRSAKICEGIKLLIKEEEKGKKIESFVSYDTTLDFLPRIWQELTNEDLDKLDGKDLNKLRMSLYYNLNLVNKRKAALDKRLTQSPSH